MKRNYPRYFIPLRDDIALYYIIKKRGDYCYWVDKNKREHYTKSHGGWREADFDINLTSKYCSCCNYRETNLEEIVLL